MPITHFTKAFACLAYFLIWTTLIYGQRPALAQTAASTVERTDEAQPVLDPATSAEQPSGGQQQASTQSVICGVKHLAQCLKDVGHDQAGIWTSPLRIEARDAFWLVPFAAGTGVALHYDAQAQQILGSTGAG